MGRAPRAQMSWRCLTLKACDTGHYFLLCERIGCHVCTFVASLHLMS
jgi:hypothetical protein